MRNTKTSKKTKSEVDSYSLRVHPVAVVPVYILSHPSHVRPETPSRHSHCPVTALQVVAATDPVSLHPHTAKSERKGDLYKYLLHELCAQITRNGLEFSIISN